MMNDPTRDPAGDMDYGFTARKFHVQCAGEENDERESA
jgi:hypothetical protein